MYTCIHSRRKYEKRKKIEVGIGFVTGRPNACNIINKYYKIIIEQAKRYNENVNITIFILYDISYQQAVKEEFYKINPNVYKDIHIKYITPENIEEDKKILKGRYGFTTKEADFILGHGHAKGRNTLMYYALKRKIDYLLFWDDDEYPVACVKDEENNELTWIEQDNVARHLQYIENSDVTIGYHCGYISPIPYVELNEDIDEELFKQYIEAISNDIISWDSIKEKFTKDNGITYASIKIANGEGMYEKKIEGKGKWVAGSTLCVNLNNLDKIPAFYNPEGARGEDTFFSINLINSRVIKVPVYHFHDGFLKYTSIIRQNYPKTLRKIKATDEEVEQRFLKASRGWIKYKPLLLYITDNENYEKNAKESYNKLKTSIPEINKIFENDVFDTLLTDFEEYDKDVKKHYQEFLKTNEIWNKLKKYFN